MSNKKLEFLTGDDFNYIIRNEKRPFIMFFSASWDENSRNMQSALEEIGYKYYEKIRVFGCDIDSAPLAAAKSNIISIPTMVLYIDGVEKFKCVGCRSESEILELLRKHEVI